tara:strand:- start:563 stop:793 length:231 start_codon:yes stop_codon:yes gene_type:complete
MNLYLNIKKTDSRNTYHKFIAIHINEKALIIFVLIFGLKTEAQINNNKEGTDIHIVGFNTLFANYYQDNLKLNPLK